MTAETFKLRVFGPAAAIYAPLQTLKGFLQLHCLTDAPGFYPRERIGRCLPVLRHYCAEGIEFEDQVRMTSRNHLVVYRFLLTPNVTTRAFLGARDQVFCVVHPQRKRLFPGPSLCRVRAKPRRRWAVAAFTTHALINLELPTA